MSDKPAIQLDQYQMEAVSSDANTVVTAGAGSGKTMVLSQRFVRLVKEQKAAADGILTLTFTRKAALEMKQRIHRDLQRSGCSEAIKVFDRAAISTLDSFCARVVKSGCLRWGISPGFTQDSDACRTLAQEQALSYLTATQDHPAVKSLLEVMSFGELQDDLLIPWVLGRGSITAPLDPDAAASAWKHRITGALGEYAARMEQVIHEGRSAARESAKHTATLTRALELLDQGEELLTLIDQGVQGEPLYELLRSCWNMRKPTGKEPGNIYFNQTGSDAWKEACRGVFLALVMLSRGDAQQEVYRWIAEFQGEYYLRLKRSQLLSFKDTAELAREMLISDRELRRWYKNRYSHIMIDEFQDNNQLQKELLYLLAERMDSEGDQVPDPSRLEPGKLFFVGDEKQSIYRFRGADVSVFKQLAEDLSGSGGRSLELKRNYRSDAGLIEQCNRIFSRVMEDAGNPWEAAYSRLLPGLEEGDDPMPMSFFFLDAKNLPTPEEGEDPAEAAESEAWYIAGRLKEEVGKRMIRREDGTHTPMEYSDAAILLRTTSSQLIYEKALRRRGIPYRSEAPRSLFLESPVNDIYLFLRLAGYPMDRRAYAGLLRSPFCALDDSAVLTVLSWEGPSFPMDEPLLEQLDEQNRRAYSRAAVLYGEVCAQADRMSHEELIRDLWYAGGYRWFLLKRREYHPYLEFYDYLMELARKSSEEGRTLAGFTDMLGSYLGRNKKLEELELPSRDGEGVRIMTVHKAKGLEFPVVILAGAGAGVKKDGPPGVFFCDEAGPVMSSPDCLDAPGSRANLLHLVEKPLAEQKEDAEVKRLFYVAMTRAMQWFVLSGIRTSKNGSSCTPLNLFLDAVGADPDAPAQQQLQEQGIRYEQIPLTSDEQMLTESTSSRPRSVLERSRWLEQARVLQYPVREHSCGVTRLVASPGRESGTLPVQGEDSGDPLLFGTLVHSLIEHFLVTGEIAGHPEELTRQVEGETDSLWEEAAELARRFSRSPLADRLSGALQRETELPFVISGPFGEEGRQLVVHGQIDLLVHWEDCCEVIDFKTDRWIEPEHHRRQLELYCEAARRLTGLPVRGKLCYLRTGEIWDLAGAER